ncbi:hypothetical protein OQA88_4525 [Cercophora sp. LCS_1]
MPHSMGDLRAKLRAKFPRRNSSILSVVGKASTNSTSGSDAQSRPPSGCTRSGREGSERSESAPASPSIDVANGTRRQSFGGDGLLVDGSPSHSSKLQATAMGSAGEEARDRLRHQPAKQGPFAHASHSTDVRAASVETDTDDGGGDANSLRQSRRWQVPAAKSRVDGSCGAKNATDASVPPAMHPVHDPSTPTAAANSFDLNGSDPQALMAKLSSITEHSFGGVATSINWNSYSPDRNSTRADAVNNTSPTSTAPAEPVRRIKLSDPPVTLSDAPPTTANLGHNNPLSSTSRQIAAEIVRRQSLLPSRQATLIRTLLGAHPEDVDVANSDLLLPISTNIMTRKIWVRRPGASATQVTINEEDLVDDVREMILRKYANSLGRSFDAPDLTLRIAPREQQRHERVLGPDEPMARTLDAYYPGGQTVDEALIIDIPSRRTPKPSPRAGPPHAQHMTSVYHEESRPHEAGTDYFGPEAVASTPSAGAPPAPNGTGHPHAISVISTGQVPQIPSPGGTRARTYRERPDRPRLARTYTSSPTILNVVGDGSHTTSVAAPVSHEQPPAGAPPPAPPLPTPPVQETTPLQIQRTATPPPRTASPRPPAVRPKKKKPANEPPLPAVTLLGGIPPINVLIVEDNIINLRLLEAFIKRLKVRWQTAMNGQEAVTKWRQGGFHLVLMDIQLPVMSGLEATREIRRLERMNSIGAFSSAPANATSKKGQGAEKDSGEAETAEATAEAQGTDVDILANREMFKSPVIIVALTASSLQPVTYVWLERKVMEWGCMQALIDYDGWRKWKSYSQNGDAEGESSTTKKSKTKKNRLSQATSSSGTGAEAK